MKKKCKFLFWENHSFKKYDISQKERIIGNVPSVWKEGIYIRNWEIWVKEKCSKCGKKRTRCEKAWEETVRSYYN